jgi:hypothetical protein
MPLIATPDEGGSFATPLINFKEPRTPGGTPVARSQLGVRWVVLMLTCILLGGE